MTMENQKTEKIINEFMESLNPEKLEFRCFSYEPPFDMNGIDSNGEEQSINTILSFDQTELINGLEFKKSISFTRIGNFDIELSIDDLIYVHELDLTNNDKKGENVICDSGLHFYKVFNLRNESEKLYMENLLLKLFKMIGRVAL